MYGSKFKRGVDGKGHEVSVLPAKSNSFGVEAAAGTIHSLQAQFPSLLPDFVEEYTLPLESTFQFLRIQPELPSLEIFAPIYKRHQEKIVHSQENISKGWKACSQRKTFVHSSLGANMNKAVS